MPSSQSESMFSMTGCLWSRKALRQGARSWPHCFSSVHDGGHAATCTASTLFATYVTWSKRPKNIPKHLNRNAMRTKYNAIDKRLSNGGIASYLLVSLTQRQSLLQYAPLCIICMIQLLLGWKVPYEEENPRHTAEIESWWAAMAWYEDFSYWRKVIESCKILLQRRPTCIPCKTNPSSRSSLGTFMGPASGTVSITGSLHSEQRKIAPRDTSRVNARFIISTTSSLRQHFQNL